MYAIWCASVKSDPGFSITKMVTRRIRSEYMKKFKDPKWETYSKCYDEMLKYRLTRRLLEHTHNPWFWSGSDTDSDSGQSPPSKNLVQAETELEECVGGRMDKTTETLPVPRLSLQNGEEEDVPSQQSANIASQPQRARDTRVAHREDFQEKDTGGPQKGKRSKSSKQTLRSQRVRPAPSRQPREDSKGSRHPFALYGSGEKEADIAGRRTHNVGPAASTDEIHGSALRAKTRREVERHFQNQRAQCRRAKSADLAKARNVVQPEFNPWLTEYMRCFSARSR